MVGINFNDRGLCVVAAILESLAANQMASVMLKKPVALTLYEAYLLINGRGLLQSSLISTTFVCQRLQLPKPHLFMW